MENIVVPHSKRRTNQVYIYKYKYVYLVVGILYCICVYFMWPEKYGDHRWPVAVGRNFYRKKFNSFNYMIKYV